MWCRNVPFENAGRRDDARVQWQIGLDHIFLGCSSCSHYSTCGLVVRHAIRTRRLLNKDPASTGHSKSQRIFAKLPSKRIISKIMKTAGQGVSAACCNNGIWQFGYQMLAHSVLESTQRNKDLRRWDESPVWFLTLNDRKMSPKTYTTS